jgi:hypothetical protein
MVEATHPAAKNNIDPTPGSFTRTGTTNLKALDTSMRVIQVGVVIRRIDLATLALAAASSPASF